METIPEPKQHPQTRAVEIIADAIRVLRTRDGIDIPEPLVLERARNAVTALEGDFDLVPHTTTGPYLERSARPLADWNVTLAALKDSFGRMDQLYVQLSKGAR